MLRRLAALAVAWVAARSVLGASGLLDMHRQWVLGWRAPAGLPSLERAAALLVGLLLAAIASRLWHGIRTAAPLAILALAALAGAQLADGRARSGAITIALAALVAIGLAADSFPLGCRNRPRRAAVLAAAATWALVCAVITGGLLAARASAHRYVGARALTHSARLLVRSVAALHVSPDVRTLIELSLLAAAAFSAVALRTALRAARGGEGHTAEQDRAARAILERYGEDTLAPFLLRADKALHFAAGGVLSYRVIGETAIVSADPVAPPGRAGDVLASFLRVARSRGWQVAIWGAGEQHLDEYRRLGLRSICVGEEAFVDPAGFTLEGRAVRKLRQSVARVRRRGWEITAVQGRDIDPALEAQIDELEHRWRASRRQLIGFAMGMGHFESEIHPDDLFVLARAPSGKLGGAMRFAACAGGRLSLDTMRRVGETPNGLNEALICHALQAARQLGVREVSLNYAGLAHLIRARHQGAAASLRARAVMALLGRRFQMERLVRFNEKFFPEWRPRHLVYESRLALPRTVVRVLQAEGYLPTRLAGTPARVRHVLPRALTARRAV
jgi:lysyl-tRNA synthetase class 2